MNCFLQLRGDELSVVLSLLDARSVVAIASVNRNTHALTACQWKVWQDLLKIRYNEVVPCTESARTLFKRMWCAEQKAHTRQLVHIEGERQRVQTDFDSACAEVLETIFDAIAHIIDHFLHVAMACLWMFGYLRIAQCLLGCNYLSRNILRFLCMRRHNTSTWGPFIRDTVFTLLISGEVLQSYRVFLLYIMYMYPTDIHIPKLTWATMTADGLERSRRMQYVLPYLCSLYALFFALAADGWDCTTLLRLSVSIPLFTVYFLAKRRDAYYAKLTAIDILTIIMFCSIILLPVILPPESLKTATAISVANLYLYSGVQGIYRWKPTASLWPRQTYCYFPLNPLIPTDKRYDPSNPQTLFM